MLNTQRLMLIRKRYSACWIAIIMLLLVSLGAPARAETAEIANPGVANPSEPSQLVCSPDQPTVETGGKLHLHAWALIPPATPIEYKWNTSAGKLEPNGPQALWTFDGVESGVYSAEVALISPGKQDQRCSIRVVVVESQRGASHTTARSFLVRDAREQSEYGLYSYLLFGSAADASSRDRYLEVIKAYLTMIYRVDELSHYVPLKKLNVTYLPIKLPAPENPTASWILENYDFARARAILDGIPRWLIAREFTSPRRRDLLRKHKPRPTTI